MNNNEYIRLSLELHLFFDRIMKEHSFFIETAFMNRDNNLRKELTETKKKHNKLASDYTRLYQISTDLNREYQVIDYNYKKDKETYEKVNSQVKDLMDTVSELDSQNKELADENKKMHSDLKKYEKRSELFDKYEYAIYHGKKRTSFTYSQLELAEDIMEEKGMDTNLLLAIAMTESGGNEKSQSTSSTAKGYGQFLSGTGKFVYEDLMKAGTYNHNYALNGKTNIKLMANYSKVYSVVFCIIKEKLDKLRDGSYYLVSKD